MNSVFSSAVRGQGLRQGQPPITSPTKHAPRRQQRRFSSGRLRTASAIVREPHVALARGVETPACVTLHDTFCRHEQLVPHLRRLSCCVPWLAVPAAARPPSGLRRHFEIRSVGTAHASERPRSQLWLSRRGCEPLLSRRPASAVHAATTTLCPQHTVGGRSGGAVLQVHRLSCRVTPVTHHHLQNYNQGKCFFCLFVCF